MAALQDDWKDLRAEAVTQPKSDGVDVLSEDWDEFRYPGLPRLPRVAYIVRGDRFENSAIEEVELIGRREKGFSPRSKRGYITYRVMDTLWQAPLYRRSDGGMPRRGNLDHIDLTFGDAISRFRSQVEAWRTHLIVCRQNARHHIAELQRSIEDYEVRLRATEDLQGICDGITKVLKDAKGHQ